MIEMKNVVVLVLVDTPNCCTSLPNYGKTKSISN